MLDAWLPMNYEFATDMTIKKLSFAGDNWQIYKMTDDRNVLVCMPCLFDKWIQHGLLPADVFINGSFGGQEFKFLVSASKYNLAPLDYKFFELDKVSALSFANSLKETRKIVQTIPLDNSIYVEQYARLLPISDLGGEINDELLLGTWITGGVEIPTTSIRRLKSLTFHLTQSDLEDIIHAAGLTEPVLSGGNTHDEVKPTTGGYRTGFANKKFSLPGAQYLEQFFFENVIDIVQNAARYEAMGIGFPAPIILYGKPGTGKTYAVEKLAEFLDWPVYSIDSSSIGSPYIHQTGQKIAAVFNKAFDNSPSIVVIDEMEAYLGKRDGAQDFKVEEVGEFLRLIPEAQKNKVLVVGMTNLLNNIDPAILRTGRFDHKIEVKMPTAEDIRNMLDTALAKLPTEPTINLDKVVESLTDRPRSDVAFVVKEAARLTAFRGKDKISQDEIDTALQTRAKTATEPQRKKIGF